MAALGFGLAALIGVALGMLGGGGSILTVPVLVYVLGFAPKEAIATSLAVVGATSVLGAIGHWRSGNVNLRVAGIFGGVAMAGTYLGARLAVFFTGGAQLILFALVMMASAYFMLRGTPLGTHGDRVEAAAVREMPFLLIAVEGIGVGILTGLVGVGGGFLIVPALVILGRLPMRQAVGTSLLVISMKSAAGFYGYLGQVSIDWAFVVPFTAVTIAGILLGAYLIGFVSQVRLQRAFAVFLLIMGTWLLYQNRGVLLMRDTTASTGMAAELERRSSATARGALGGGVVGADVAADWEERDAGSGGT